MKRVACSGSYRAGVATLALACGLAFVSCGGDDENKSGDSGSSADAKGSDASTGVGGSGGSGGSVSSDGSAGSGDGAGRDASSTDGADGSDAGSTTDTTGSADAQLADIVDTATAAGTFKTLITALAAADLTTTLKGAGPFTIFAPTDAAFAKLPAGTVDTLLKPENKAKLQAILTYHVLARRITSTDVAKLTTAKTVEGHDIAITVAAGRVKINDANVTAVDIAASNGLIHVIDTVLIPQ